MLIIQISQVGVALIHIALGLFVLRARSSNVVNRAFAAQSLLFAGWILGLSGLHNSATVQESFQLAFAFASLIPVGFLFFTSCYPTATAWPRHGFVRVIFSIGAAFAFLSVATDLIVYDAAIGATGVTRKAGLLYPAFAVYFIVTWCAGLWIFVRKWRASQGLARAQYRYLGAGLIGGSFGGISTNLLAPWLTGYSTYSWVGPYFTLVYVGFVAHAIIRHRFLDLRLFIHRGLTIAVASVLSAAPVCALLAAFWPRLLTTLEPFELAWLLMAVAAVTILIPITRDIAGRLIDRYVYRTHANFQQTLREASRVLTRVLDLDKLLAFIATTVVRSTGVEGVAIYLRDSDAFRCAIAEKGPAAGDFAAPTEVPANIVAGVAAAQEPILTEETVGSDSVLALALHRELTHIGWALLLPVRSEDTLIAIIAVGPKLSGDFFYQQDIDLLMTLANQAAIAIKNARLYAAMVVANEYLENIVATLETGVIAVNANAQIAIFNRAAQHLTGLSQEMSRGGTVHILPACLAEPLLATIHDGEPRTHPEIELPCAAATSPTPPSRPVICITSPVRDPAGAILGAVAVFSDLTPLKELEVQRRNAERLHYFQMLASGLAHEIKNPLVAIKTFMQLLPRRHQEPRFLEEFGLISNREIERMQRIVDRLSALARPTDATRESIDVRGPLTDALDFVQPMLEEKNLAVSLSMPAQPCVIMGNAGELEQLFLNLLLNAHDATPSGGKVTIGVRSTEAQVCITISDTGPGIAPEVLDRIFEPFFTTKRRGSGLGLAISSGIVQGHGGRLHAANEALGGASFSVELPLATTPSVIA